MATPAFLSNLAATIATNQTVLNAQQQNVNVRLQNPSLRSMQAANMVNRPMQNSPQGQPPQTQRPNNMPMAGNMPSSPMRSLEGRTQMANANAPRPRSFSANAARDAGQQRAIATEKKFQQAQMQMAQQNAMDRANSVYQLLMSKKIPPQQAKAVAQQAFADPDIAKKVMDQFGSDALTRTTLTKELDNIFNLPEGEKRDMMIAKWFKDNGQSFSGSGGTNPDGTTYWNFGKGEGGKAPSSARVGSEQFQIPIYQMDTVTRRKLEDEMGKVSEDLFEIQDISSGLEEDWLTYQGAIKAGIGDFVGKLGFKNPLVFDAAERGGYLQKVKRRVLAFRKRITGVAGGEKEFKAIESALANAEQQSPAAFMLALENEFNDGVEKYNNYLTRYAGDQGDANRIDIEGFSLFDPSWKEAYLSEEEKTGKKRDQQAEQNPDIIPAPAPLEE